MTTIKAPHRSLIALALPGPVPALISYAEQIVTACTGNPTFPTPSPTLAVITQAINDLQAAEAAAISRQKGAVQARNDKRTALVKLLELFKAYVQTVADANNDTAPTVIKSAGLAVRKTPVRKPHTFEIKQGTTSGSVKISTVSAGPRSAYDWQYSTDGGKTWLAMLSTVQAKTTLLGLTAGTTVMFRYRTITKTGVSDWVAPVSFFVN
jgi:hypothetical protein